MALGKTQVRADLALNHPGNPRASTPSGQLQTTSECHHPDPAQLVLHGGRGLVVRGHSQSLQPTGLAKFLPLTCQRQSRLNYRRREHTAHTVGTPGLPVLVMEKAVPQGPTAHLLHKVTLRRLGDIAALPHTYKHREIATMRRQRNMSQMKEQKKAPEKELIKMKTKQAIYQMQNSKHWL